MKYDPTPQASAHANNPSSETPLPCGDLSRLELFGSRRSPDASDSSRSIQLAELHATIEKNARSACEKILCSYPFTDSEKDKIRCNFPTVGLLPPESDVIARFEYSKLPAQPTAIRVRADSIDVAEAYFHEVGHYIRHTLMPWCKDFVLAQFQGLSAQEAEKTICHVHEFFAFSFGRLADSGSGRLSEIRDRVYLHMQQTPGRWAVENDQFLDEALPELSLGTRFDNLIRLLGGLEAWHRTGDDHEFRLGVIEIWREVAAAGPKILPAAATLRAVDLPLEVSESLCEYLAFANEMFGYVNEPTSVLDALGSSNIPPQSFEEAVGRMVDSTDKERKLVLSGYEGRLTCEAFERNVRVYVFGLVANEFVGSTISPDSLLQLCRSNSVTVEQTVRSHNEHVDFFVKLYPELIDINNLIAERPRARYKQHLVADPNYKARLSTPSLDGRRREALKQLARRSPWGALPPITLP